MPDIKVKGYTGDYIHLSGVEKLWMESEESTDAERKLLPYSYGETVEGVQIQPDFSAGDMPVSAGEGLLVKSAVIKKPEGLIPENIAEGEYIAGVGPGTHSGGTGQSQDADIVMGTISGTYSNASVSMVKPYAFYNAKSLKEIIFPNCSHVGSSAFAGCTALSSVRLPTCKKVSAGAFSGCNLISTIHLPECEELGAYACYNVRSTASFYAPKLKWVGSSAFAIYTSVLSSVCYRDDIAVTGHYRNYASLSESTRVIAAGCFAGNSFPTIARGANVQYIGERAYSNCSWIGNADFPECLGISTAAFQSCSRLYTISFPKCEIIGDNAFGATSSLYAVKINTADFPECKTIGNSAFYSCINLDTINFPKCETIGSSAFTLAPIATASFPMCRSIGSYAFSSAAVRQYYLPEIETIGSYALNVSVCNNLHLGSSKRFDYSNIFSGSFSVPMLTIDGNAGWRGFAKAAMEYVRFMGRGTIYGNLFWSCKSLAKARVEKFGFWTGMFSYCPKLSIASGHGDYVAKYAFSSCASLSYLKCRYAPSYISDYAFYSCYKLSVLYIEEGFLGSYSSCRFGSSYVFANVPTIYVPESMVETFQAADGWSAYASKITAVTDEIKDLFKELI